MAGTIYSGTYVNGIVLSDPTAQNPATVAAGGYITNRGTAHSGDAVYGYAPFAWTFSNYGAITSASGDGVRLRNGGSVSNAGTITAAHNGIEIDGTANAAGTVVNSGTITSTGTQYAGIALADGGNVTNSGLLISSQNGIFIAGAAGAVSNLGTINSGGTAGSGIFLSSGGSVTNTGAISAPIDGIAIDGGAGTVVNSGTVTGSGTQSIDIALFAGGSVTNTQSGLLTAAQGGIYVTGAAGTVSNFGTIDTSGPAGVGIVLTRGGSITNAGAISAPVGIVIAGGSGTVFNSGTIAGTGEGGIGVYLGSPGSTLTNAGTISGGSGTAVTFYGSGNRLILDPGAVLGGTSTVVGTATVDNTLELAAGAAGTINSLFFGFDTFQEDASASWTVPGSFTFSNGTIGTGASLSETGPLTFDNSLVNSGTIAASVTLGAGGTLDNRAGGTIVGNPAVFGSDGTLVNAGMIIGSSGTAVVFAGSGNRLVLDPGAGFSGVVNGGTAGTLELAAGAGTVSGLGTSFVGFANVAVDPGAVWQVSGGAPAPGFTNDGTIVVGSGGLVLGAVGEDSGDSGAIDLGGTAEFAGAVAAGQSLTFTDAAGLARLDQPGSFAGAIANFQAGDALDLAGVAADGYTYAGGVLTLSDNGNAVARLTLATPYVSPVFALAADGSGGTVVSDRARAGLAGQVVLSTAPERTALPADTALARFSGDATDTAGGFTATIAWGDGTTSAGTVTGGNGAFTVEGGHSFADEGRFPLAVTLVRSADNTTLALTGTVTATENDSLSAQSAALNAIAGHTFSGTVASFADTDAAAPAGDFTATIAWGDSTTSAGTVSGGTGVFTVSGTHQFGAAGALPLSVTLAEDAPGTAAATAAGTARVVPGNIFPGYYPNGIQLYNPAIQSPPTITATGSVTNAPGQDSVTASSGFAWTITNQGRISGPGNGIVLSATGAVLNSGTIAGTNGVVLDAGGSVQNSGGGVVNGSGYGVTIAGGAATVVNAGTIGGGGGTAVQFGAGDDLLAVYPGAVFNGQVLGGAGDNGLELTAGNGAGTLFGLGSKFRNFAAIQIDPGAVWRLSGAPATAPDSTNDGRIAVGGGHTLLLGAVGEDPGAHGAIVVRSGGTIEFAGGVDPQQTVRFADNTGTLVLDDPPDFGATIRGFQSGDAIDLAGAAADGMSYADGVLTLLSGNDPVAALTIPGGFSASQFAVTPDGRGGTTVSTVPGQLFAFTFVYDDGQAYYQGTVADDGSLGYAAIAASANPTITVPGGVYTLAADGPTSEPSGAVRVADYFASPPQANGGQGFVPLATGRGQFDGSGGLGSESDAIRVNGTAFGFSPSLEFHPILAA